jgi:glutamate-1-semialdehyde 2,1-aminomutase
VTMARNRAGVDRRRGGGRPSERAHRPPEKGARPRSREARPGLSRERVEFLTERESRRFLSAHPRSHQLFQRASGSLLAGVPMNWMTKWPGGFPLFVREGRGARVWDVDNLEYVDFCLGDTGAMFGHSPPEVVAAVSKQLKRGITTMLPAEASIWVAEELARRFGLPYWQMALTATDANRFAIRIAREVTRRPKILVFNGCYHGTVDETLVELDHGTVVPVPANVGPPVEPGLTTRVVEFNDVRALEKALEPHDVAAVLAEPAMTNRGIILPEPGFHDQLRALTRAHGTLLILDETHTLSEGPGGYTAAHGLRPDMVTLGKPIGSGIPAAAFGMTSDLMNRSLPKLRGPGADESGIGGTLSGNALAAVAMQSTLRHLITEKAYARMIPMAERFVAGVESTIEEFSAPWHVVRLGARAEYRFSPTPPRNGAEALSLGGAALDRLVHLYMLNRGVLLTPFHNMALMSPYTRRSDVDRHTRAFRAFAQELLAS